MANKNKNIQPSPFHKKGRNEGDSKRNFMGRLFRDPLGFGGKSFLGFGKGETYDSDEWGIKKATADADRSFGDFQKLKDSSGENLWADAENLIDVDNYYGGVKETVSGLENTMEDLTVNTQAADFQRDMSMQQNVNLMDMMMASGSGSGAATNAQALSNIMANQNLQLSGELGSQESANQLRKATQAAELQKLGVSTELSEAQSLTSMDLASDQGAMEAQKFRLQGEADARQLQIQMQQAELSYLAGLKESAEANKDVDTAGKSDRRLKKNINKIGESASGLNIYSFEYKNPADGIGLFQGVMSDEIPLEAVVDSGDWYDLVNYSMLDVEFKQI